MDEDPKDLVYNNLNNPYTIFLCASIVLCSKFRFRCFVYRISAVVFYICSARAQSDSSQQFQRQKFYHAWGQSILVDNKRGWTEHHIVFF
jgi:hypothetical protein